MKAKKSQRYGLRRVLTAMGLSGVLAAASLLASGTSASAASCNGAWRSASWGRAWICSVYNSNLGAYRVYGQVQDTDPNDHYCAQILVARFFTGDQQLYIKNACYGQGIVNFDWSVSSTATKCRGTSANTVFAVADVYQYSATLGDNHWFTLWDNPYC